MTSHGDANSVKSDFSVSMPSTVCQGSMGLHQNNFKLGNVPRHGNSSHENVIVEVFRKFRDHCMSKLRESGGNLSNDHNLWLCTQTGKNSSLINL